METKPYAIKTERPRDAIDDLANLHREAARIERARKDLDEVERNIEAIKPEYAAEVAALHRRMLGRLNSRAAKLQESIEDAREVIRHGLLSQPEGRRKLLRGDKTWYIREGSEAVEILDDAKAQEEIRALGPAGAFLIVNKPTISKVALKAFLRNPESPKLEYARIKTGDATLAEREEKE